MFKSTIVNGEPKLYANECANDLWVREIVFPGRRGGYFVEAGAADGISGSSCFFLERQLGWTGLCIEPHDGFFQKLRTNRPNSIHVNACLARNAGTADYVMVPAQGSLSPFLSGVRGVLEQYKYRGSETAASGVSLEKPAVRLIDLLRSNNAPHQIDYGAFDIEGSEFEALADFPFNEYRFLALTFEVDGSIAEPLSNLLKRNEYVQTQNPFTQDCPWEQYWLYRSIAPGTPAA